MEIGGADDCWLIPGRGLQRELLLMLLYSLDLFL